MEKMMDIGDFESMILTSVLGVLVSLKEDIISMKQAESYWLSDMIVELFKQLPLSDDLIDLIEAACQLKKFEQFSPQYYQQIDNLIELFKASINLHYTEYENTLGVIN